MTAKIELQTVEFNKKFRKIAALRAKEIVFIGTDVSGYEPLIIFGIYRDFSVDVAYPDVNFCSLEVEGLI